MSSRGLARYHHQKARTPAWADKKAMAGIYIHARRRGSEFEVDHIVPLNHPLVCGLHCEHNLVIVRALYNRKKGNYYWPDMPMEVVELPLEEGIPVGELCPHQLSLEL